ncbi:endopeptidase La [Sedimentibacter sp. zth1]|uniref:endopeptidase La n=1 Tax=Sedimentibacter sp. zth1 TaxID=2816908 RepID=UPI001F5F081C|nr:endopeptidase La [Sedimentibacter sp. zth1]
MENYNLENKKLPLIPIRGIGIFPNMLIHFDVGREKSVNALEEAMLEDSNVFLTVQKEATLDTPTKDDFYDIGVVCKIKQMLKISGENIRVLAEGINRGKIIDIIQDEPYFEANIDEYSYINDDQINEELEATKRVCVETFELYAEVERKISTETVESVRNMKNPNKLADTITSFISLKPEDKQRLLQIFDPFERFEELTAILAKETNVLQIEDQISERVRKQVSEFQREYYLKEQIKAIQKELGYDDYEDEDNYRTKIKKLKIPKDIKEKINKEINKLDRISASSPDAGVIRTYLDFVLELPWNKKSKDNLDIKKAKEILKKDHFGLEEVKERILEHLAVRQLNPSQKGSIICLVGPPGVGKTSIAGSIARAMDKKFVRISLGGVRDESEIRGHRRTYVGAIPGRIIDSISKCKVNNPVFLLDEIDKLASDFRGDPASALLEALDPEQNSTFTDHYLDVSFDLSKVMFITTANTTSTIPSPLLDRMEVIEISGYTDEEKFNIAEKYLIKKQLKNNGLTTDDISISKVVIKEIINHYTRESGVRGLERNIGKIIRKSAVQILEKHKKPIVINSKNISSYLGAPRYLFDEAYDENQIGLVTGLAWTSVGGETLFVEVNVMKGEGKLQLTGQLGDVMKESAIAGLSYIKANAEKYGIDSKVLKENDVHVHVPEGAIPKDGPSAGITITTAILSALTNTYIYKDVAMTGEITIRGRVLPIGGLKEKLLAAKRAGIKKVIVPMKNKPDVEKINSKVIKTLDIVYATTIDEVIDSAFVK